jgi:uncharacterized membrane protein
MAALAVRLTPHRRTPAALWWCSAILGFLGWGCSALRHDLLQSNAYDLGLFDQWVWLIGRGLEPVSSMEHVHVLADHGAWLLYGAGAAYGLLPGVHWLLASQAIALSFTAIPIWWLGQQAGLTPKHCWLACALWWLQPVVFNTILFDFHPETWVMPAFALTLWAERAAKPRLWLALLLLMLGARDGLILVIAGMALDLGWRQRWRWCAAAGGLSIVWLLILSQGIYPLLRGGSGPKAAERMFGHLGGGFLSLLSSLEWGEIAFYLLILSLPLGWLWRRSSLSTLLIGSPLLLVNLLSASASYRTLVHHYSLPLALIAVVAAIRGGLQSPSRRGIPTWGLIWATACWLALAKPWFFTGPYLERQSDVEDVKNAISLIQQNDSVLTTSYLVPQLSHRQTIAFPKRSFEHPLSDTNWSVLLLNPKDPGWGSSARVQRSLLNQAQTNGWTCRDWPSNLSLCQKGETQTNASKP